MARFELRIGPRGGLVRSLEPSPTERDANIRLLRDSGLPPSHEYTVGGWVVSGRLGVHPPLAALPEYVKVEAIALDDALRLGQFPKVDCAVQSYEQVYYSALGDLSRLLLQHGKDCPSGVRAKVDNLLTSIQDRNLLSPQEISTLSDCAEEALVYRTDPTRAVGPLHRALRRSGSDGVSDFESAIAQCAEVVRQAYSISKEYKGSSEVSPVMTKFIERYIQTILESTVPRLGIEGVPSRIESLKQVKSFQALFAGEQFEGIRRCIGESRQVTEFASAGIAQIQPRWYHAFVPSYRRALADARTALNAIHSDIRAER